MSNCPKCGTQPAIHWHRGNDGSDRWMMYCGCVMCASGPSYKLVMAAWERLCERERKA